MLPRYTSPLSQVVWNAQSVGALSNSPGVQIFNCPYVTVFGTVSAATTLYVNYSQDGVNWYLSKTLLNLTGAGGFSIDFQTGVEFVSLHSTSAVTITAIFSAK